MEYRTHIQTSYSFANVRSILRIYGKEHDNKWNEYMEYTEEMYEVNLHVPAQWVWGSLPEEDREAAVSCLEQLCAQKGLGWGSGPQRTSLARWRVCNLQRAANKFHQRRLGIACLPASRLSPLESDSGASRPSVGVDARTHVQGSDAGNIANARSVEPHDTASCPNVANANQPPRQKIFDLSEDAGLIQKYKPVRKPFDPIRDLNPSYS